MCRMIYLALFGLLLSNGALFAQARAGRSTRPQTTVVIFRSVPRRTVVFPQYNILFCPVPYPVPYAVPYPVSNFVETSPAYVFAGTISESHPQLVFKDGTTYTVTDYWRKDDQLHFITSEDGGTKSVPHVAPFGDLDVQRTTQTDEARGFRFVMRSEPLEQWLDGHGQRH